MSQMSKSLLSLLSSALLLNCHALAGQEPSQRSDVALVDGVNYLSAETIAKWSPRDIESRLPSVFPVSYFFYAGRLWREAEKDKAVFWYYIGELRFRFQLLAEPNNDPSGGSALLGSLQEVLGRPINLYAASDTSKWANQINAVLQWDESNPNHITSKSKYRKEWQEVRGGMVKLHDYILAHADEIKKQRAQEGIGEVGVKNGVYVQESKRKMPIDWPVLEGDTRLDGIVGVYTGSLDLANALFSRDRPKVLRATTFEISRNGSDSILVSAKKGDKELLSRTIQVREENGAVVFDERSTPDDMSEGTVQVTSYLRLNSGGELVIQRDLVAEGKYKNNSQPFRDVFTFWLRAPRVGPN